MGVEQLVAKGRRAVALDDDFMADTGERGGRIGEGERDEGRAVGVVGDVVLFGDAQREVGRAQFGVRRAPQAMTRCGVR